LRGHEIPGAFRDGFAARGALRNLFPQPGAFPPQLRSTLARPIIGISVMPASITCSTIGRLPRLA
jgi:hypothetical protein